MRLAYLLIAFLAGCGLEQSEAPAAPCGPEKLDPAFQQPVEGPCDHDPSDAGR